MFFSSKTCHRSTTCVQFCINLEAHRRHHFHFPKMTRVVNVKLTFQKGLIKAKCTKNWSTSNSTTAQQECCLQFAFVFQPTKTVQNSSSFLQLFMCIDYLMECTHSTKVSTPPQLIKIFSSPRIEEQIGGEKQINCSLLSYY